MKATIRQATSRGSIPERRSAQAVSATPPAPAVANRRVASHAGHRDLVALAPADPHLPPHEHRLEEHHVARERQRLEDHADRDPPRVAPLDPVAPSCPRRSSCGSTKYRKPTPRARTARGDERRRVSAHARHRLPAARPWARPRASRRAARAPSRSRLLAPRLPCSCARPVQTASCAIASSAATAPDAQLVAPGAANGAQPAHGSGRAPRPRSGPRRSARPDTPARSRASPRTPNRAHRPPVPPRRAGAQP